MGCAMGGTWHGLMLRAPLPPWSLVPNRWACGCWLSVCVCVCALLTRDRSLGGAFLLVLFFCALGVLFYIYIYEYTCFFFLGHMPLCLPDASHGMVSTVFYAHITLTLILTLTPT
ncbi:unnamed protein product, partial [Discosporangium mesarthrocarpum]